MAPPGMKWIDGGEFAMGSDEFYAEESPVHRVAVDGFWMDEHAVTAADFRRFVRDTGYVTVAERPLDPDDYPDADPELLVPGSLVVPKEPRAGERGSCYSFVLLKSRERGSPTGGRATSQRHLAARLQRSPRRRDTRCAARGFAS